MKQTNSLKDAKTNCLFRINQHKMIFKTSNIINLLRTQHKLRLNLPNPTLGFTPWSNPRVCAASLLSCTLALHFTPESFKKTYFCINMLWGTLREGSWIVRIRFSRKWIKRKYYSRELFSRNFAKYMILQKKNPQKP